MGQQPNQAPKPRTETAPPATAGVPLTAEQLEINELKAKLAILSSGMPQTTEAALAALASTMNPDMPGHTIRPVQGPMHPIERAPIFNNNRPTGKHG